jgi:hypothetical protein
MSAKQDLLNDAANEYRSFHESIHGLNEEHMTEAWLGTWCIRDVIAHISGWQREMAPALERLARGERPLTGREGYDDVDAWNARFADAQREMSVADVLLEFDRVHEQFLHAAAQVPDDRYVPDKTAWKIVDLNGVQHYREHREEILAWRASRDI